ncbi:MAG: hypothetical protein R3F37_22905 [Candidatus Competibacteraceae bacterium]
MQPRTDRPAHTPTCRQPSAAEAVRSRKRLAALSQKRGGGSSARRIMSCIWPGIGGFFHVTAKDRC